MSEARTARVRVPASAANVGAGYDCIGFAVDRWLTASVTASADSGLGAPEVTIRRDGTLTLLTLAAADDAVVAGFAAACHARGRVGPGFAGACHGRGRALPRRLDFHVDSEIPVSRGLGASTAALVAGASLANAALELGLDRRELAELCTELEGHPDNVAPSVVGGAVLGVGEGEGESPQWVLGADPGQRRFEW